MYSPGFTSQVYYKIEAAEKKLGALSRGQKADLILDNFQSVRSSAEAHKILDIIYGPAAQKATCGHCGSAKPAGQSCGCFDNGCQ